MVIILNNTKKGENPLVLKPKYYTADGTEVTRQDASMATSANFDVECGENYRFTLMTASNPKIILAAAKRFLSGVSWLKCGATYHEFFVDEEVVIVDRPNKGAGMERLEDVGIPLATIPFKQKARTPAQKTVPMHAIVIISDVNAAVTTRMNNQTNYSERTTFTNGPYQYDIFLIRWSGWKNMKYRAALIVDVDGETSVYELGYVENKDTKYCKDCLVKLNKEGTAEFLKYEKELEEKKADKAAAADEEKNVRRYPSPNGKRPFNKNQKTTQHGNNRKPNFNQNRYNNSGNRPNNEKGRPNQNSRNNNYRKNTGGTYRNNDSGKYNNNGHKRSTNR